jgi:GT2 family glycosyltransferase
VVALVRALLDDPALLEVIVVVDGEDQPTFAALVALAASSPRLVPIQQPHGGAGAARQNGVQQAHGDVVLLLDDDVMPAPGLVSAHAAQHRAAPGRLVVGSLPPVRAPRRTVHSVVDEIYAVDYDVCYRDYVTNPHSVLQHLWAGNMSLDRNVALEVGIGDAAFDSLFFEDRDLGLRLRRAGVKAVFCPELRADHHHVGTLTGYLRDSLRQGRALVLLRRRIQMRCPSPRCAVLRASSLGLLAHWCGGATAAQTAQAAWSAGCCSARAISPASCACTSCSAHSSSCSGEPPRPGGRRGRARRSRHAEWSGGRPWGNPRLSPEDAWYLLPFVPTEASVTSAGAGWRRVLQGWGVPVRENPSRAHDARALLIATPRARRHAAVNSLSSPDVTAPVG